MSYAVHAFQLFLLWSCLNIICGLFMNKNIKACPCGIYQDIQITSILLHLLGEILTEA